jgi:ATP-dependent RNA helicase RhlE
MTKFADLGLAEPLLRAVTAKGYDTPSPIQAQAIPHVMTGRDLMGLAQTGTGKTAAFALPILHRLLSQPQPLERCATRVLVLAPTRELAAQIGAGFEAYGASMRLRVAVIFGGVPVGKQVRQLSGGVDVIVATPGRLLDLIGQRAVRLDRTEVLVLDEADHMFDLGFIIPIRRILRLLPEQRQTLLFSATMPKEIRALAADCLTEPLEVSVSPAASTPEKVAQQVIAVASHGEKPGALEDFLRTVRVTRGIIFCRTKHGADKVVDRLLDAGFSAGAIHGNKKQAHRERTLAAFRSGEAALLVATDIAARGIDVPEVSHVINYDMPEVPETYVHRIGRTARAGHTGEAVSFVAPDEISLVRGAERLMKIAIPGSPTGQGAPRPARQQQRSGRPQQPQQPRAPRSENTSQSRPFGPSAKPQGPRSEGPRPHGPRPEGPRREARPPRADGPYQARGNEGRDGPARSGEQRRSPARNGQGAADGNGGGGDRSRGRNSEIWSNW